MTHLHISVPAINRGTLARTHELKKDYRHAKACKQNYTYDWANFIQPGTLRKLAVKELNKYTECHNLHGVYIRINEKAI